MMRAEYEHIQTGSEPATTIDRTPVSQTLSLAGVAVENRSRADVLGDLTNALVRDEPVRLVFLNAHCVNVSQRDRAYREALSRCTVLPDGVGVDLGALVLHGRKFIENLNGTDFVPYLFDAVKTPLKVALVGGAPTVARDAAANLKRRASIHEFVAVSDGYFGEAGRSNVLKQLETGGFDVVLVAMGVPAQELFMTNHLDARHGRLFIGVGALFDFLAGRAIRAPLVIRRLRLEWVWRMAREPGRLWRRYILGNPLFLAHVLRERFRAGSST